MVLDSQAVSGIYLVLDRYRGLALEMARLTQQPIVLIHEMKSHYQLRHRHLAQVRLRYTSAQVLQVSLCHHDLQPGVHRQHQTGEGIMTIQTQSRIFSSSVMSCKDLRKPLPVLLLRGER